MYKKQWKVMKKPINALFLFTIYYHLCNWLWTLSLRRAAKIGSVNYTTCWKTAASSSKSTQFKLASDWPFPKLCAVIYYPMKWLVIYLAHFISITNFWKEQRTGKKNRKPQFCLTVLPFAYALNHMYCLSK